MDDVGLGREGAAPRGLEDVGDDLGDGEGEGEGKSGGVGEGGGVDEVSPG